MNKYSKNIILIVVSATICVKAVNASNSPQGKPFVAINDKIVEIEGGRGMSVSSKTRLNMLWF